jgi:Fic family protein
MTSPSRGHHVPMIWEPILGGLGRPHPPTPYEAFVPEPIGDYEPVLGSATVARCETAAERVRELNESSTTLVPLEGLGRQLLRSEALASSQIEGLSISQRKLAEAELEGREDFRAREIVGTMRAMEKALEIAAQPAPLGLETILEIHREISIVPPLDRIAGQIREEPSWIGGADPPSAEFVGPPQEEVRPLLEDLCRFINRADVSVVAQAAIAHAQFETIHPFGDGNGRVGRCLIQVVFRRRGLAPRYLAPVSIVLGANKDAYIDGLEGFRAGEVDAWVDQFAGAVELAALRADEFSERVLALQEEWRERVRPARSDAAALALIDLLPRYPVITAAIAEHEIDRSRRATLTGLERLAEADVLTRHRNQRKGDLWESKELFRLLQKFEREARAVGR